MSVISNTTVISNFSSIGQIDLLRQLYGELYITVEVYKEVQNGIEEGYKFYSGFEELLHPVATEGWMRLTGLADEREFEIFAETPASLHQGEAASLAIAYNRSWLFLTDDKAARKGPRILEYLFRELSGALLLASIALSGLWRRQSWLVTMS